MRQVRFPGTFAGWQAVAREVLRKNVRPGEIIWTEDAEAQDLLFGGESDIHAAGFTSASNSQAARSNATVPKVFMTIARRVACHRDQRKWALLYSILWRLTHGERNLLAIRVDPDVERLTRLSQAVSRDAHMMVAFVRFRKVLRGGEEHYIAWHKPDHMVLPLVVPWFVRRFAVMRWSILTPDLCAHWDLRQVYFSPGIRHAAVPEGDALEDLWVTYYSSIFNPARANLECMRSHMPEKHWETLPEARVISSLLHEAPGAVERMVQKSKKKQ